MRIRPVLVAVCLMSAAACSGPRPAAPAVAPAEMAPASSGASLDSDGGVLHALDPATGKSVARVTVGPTNRFATAALSGATVIVPTLRGIAVIRVR